MFGPVTVETEFLHYTGTAGEVCRYLCLVAIAIIWLFVRAGTTGGRFALPQALQPPLILVIVSLAIDALQYLVGSSLFGSFLLWFSSGKQANVHEFHELQGLAVVLVLMIFLKLATMVGAYCFLGYAVWRRLEWQP
jgi:hypothetical protein